MTLRKKSMNNSPFPQQISPESISLLPIAPEDGHLNRREPLWDVTDETMRNWLKQAVSRAAADGVHFSIPVTPHTFRHSYTMHMLYHRQPKKVIQALAGALDMAATLVVPFTGDGRGAADILRSQTPMKE